MNSTSVSDIVAGIVVAWFIIKGIEKVADWLGRNSDPENEKPRPSPKEETNRGV